MWEQTWDLQREEDRDRPAPGYPGPAEVHQRRLPEELLLAAPRQARRPEGALHLLPRPAPTATTPLLLGWAGWDHREQAHALITIIEERSTTDGWDSDA